MEIKNTQTTVKQFIKACLAINPEWLDQVLNHPVAEEKEIAEVKLIHLKTQLNDTLIESYRAYGQGYVLTHPVV